MQEFPISFFFCQDLINQLTDINKFLFSNKSDSGTQTNRIEKDDASLPVLHFWSYRTCDIDCVRSVCFPSVSSAQETE